MAIQSVSISAAVGTRNGITPLPNLPGDIETIKDLFDRIGSGDGGTSDIPGPWASERTLLIAEITGQIAVFQATNRPLAVDMAIDRGGNTLRKMNQFASEPPVSATVAPPPSGYDQDFVTSSPMFAAPASMPGRAPLMAVGKPTEYSRRLVSFNGSSIKWYGVVLSSGIGQSAASAIPHIFFTPTPIQGGYRDETYDSFGGWGQLWHDYTERIGGLISAAGANHILVIPFYKTAQGFSLGSFLQNWKEVISAVVTAALNDMNPYYLQGDYSFDTIVSSSFSNGVNAHRNFNSSAVGAGAMTQVLFDLDGVAQTGGSNWRPAKGVIYQNRGSPTGQNPIGNNWYVGGRWSDFDAYKPQTSKYSHHACSEHLLYHGLVQYCL